MHPDSETSEWDKWKSSLGKVVNTAEAAGMSERAVDNIAYRVGNVLNAVADPNNVHQLVLKELWKVGDDEEKKTLANLIVKLVKSD
ncbi:DUF3243 domain-containing protein [Ruminiclostridium cellulolyticum]|uniref:DUF3243 domain-containing protein n=1 Tax=Ruminiclostridium cellulolyticum (strain ATCC 35319 / DSM 5812 / JCM 6584 / H10) TaxID=394503 RepID=B8I1E9_RUMCH|nr:DUF3243 domain-containing protein [Ruminiclostridium cellulolyticum]ACL75747.1 conserved hypothetical protein [Ruminiclostridium cellulolyticum H10]